MSKRSYKLKHESWMPDFRTTDYKEGQRMEITDEVFHDYKIGEIVIIKNADNFSYHVCSENNKRWWWVKEHQIKPIKDENQSKGQNG